jgi:hypothetical protein
MRQYRSSLPHSGQSERDNPMAGKRQQISIGGLWPGQSDLLVGSNQSERCDLLPVTVFLVTLALAEDA